LIEVGLPDRIAGCGTRDAEAWEFESLIGDQTAGILYLARADSRPDLPSVVRVAHAANVPVLVDAAAELPPARNLRRFIEEGADLVVFSGGKALGGPSGSGLLCGRRHLVGSALIQQLDLDGTHENWGPPSQLIDKSKFAGVPRNGIGRSCKVGKEQIIGLLTALTRFAQEDDDARNRRWGVIANAMVAVLTELPGLRVRVTEDWSYGGMPLVEVVISAGPGKPNASQIASRLRSGSPAVHVGAADADHGILMLVPTCLATADAVIIQAAFAAALAAGP
jgi:L-seryl-tRNA(Ser) seleniumtransferase